MGHVWQSWPVPLGKCRVLVGQRAPGEGLTHPGAAGRAGTAATAGIELPALPAFPCTALHCWHHAAGSAAIALCRRIPSSSAATTACPASRRRSPRGRSGSPGRSHAAPLLGPLRLWQHGHRRPRRGAPAWGSSWPPASAALHTKERSGGAVTTETAAERGAGRHRAAGGGRDATRDANGMHTENVQLRKPPQVPALVCTGK